MIRYLVSECGVSVDILTNDGRTPLYVAASFGRELSVAVLQALGADCAVLNEKETSPLSAAAFQGHLSRPTAGRAGRPLDESPDSGPRRCIQRRRARQRRDSLPGERLRVPVDVRTKDGRTPLYVAASFGRSMSVGLLHDLGADCTTENDKESSPLGTAAFKGHLEVIRLLVLLGCDPLASRPSSGFTALHSAAERGHDDIIRYLVGDCGFTVDVRTNDGRTPLYVAASFGRDTSVGMLYDLGADLVAITDKESSPLDMAAFKGHLETVRADQFWRRSFDEPPDCGVYRAALRGGGRPRQRDSIPGERLRHIRGRPNERWPHSAVRGRQLRPRVVGGRAS